MALRITNPTASGVLNNLNRTDSRLREVLERLSSGQRVNRARDDAAALAISESMRADIRVFDQAIRNASDAVSLVQTAEGGLDETTGLLARMDELAMEAGGVALNDEQRQLLDQEFQQLKAEVDRISAGTEFNGQKLLSGEFVGKTVQIAGGSGTEAAVTIDIQSNPATGDNSFSATGLGVAGASVTTQANATAARQSLQTAREEVLGSRSQLGGLQSRFESIVASIRTARENTIASESQIRDADVAFEASNLVREQLLTKTGVASLVHSNLSNQRLLDLL